jgi:uncharacterized protein YdiU (UPF0061 family)
MNWINRFAKLGPGFSAEVLPSPVPEPAWVCRNFELAQRLGLPQNWLEGTEGLAVFSGNGLWDGMQSRASVYSGHQFGQWAGQLGDGRALSLGEFETAQGAIEIQLKGAGKTPFSRMGDGRAVLRSSIREYLCSEAMAGLGIPSTRALCITTSPQRVLREDIETAAIVTRTAPSFIRFGHFEHFANQANGLSQLKELADFTLANFVQANHAFSENRYANLLYEVTQSTARLMAQWQSVGFCHGVMNTDNMSIMGLSLDYGPFQFMDGFNPNHICNHTDQMGRYAYGRQPQVAYWNLFCLAQALMPLIETQDLAMRALESYKLSYSNAWTQKFLAKMGIEVSDDPTQLASDTLLLNDLLENLAAEQVDFTVFWRHLSAAVTESSPAAPAWHRVADLFIDPNVFQSWQTRYLTRLENLDTSRSQNIMRNVNPKYILRNHLAESAIQKSKMGDHSEVETLFKLLQSPFDDQMEFDHYAQLPPEWASSIEISCSS